MSLAVLVYFELGTFLPLPLRGQDQRSWQQLARRVLPVTESWVDRAERELRSGLRLLVRSR